MTGGTLNWKEIDLILAELDLPGCLVREIHQPRHDRFVLELFREGRHVSVLVSLSPRLPRLHALTEKPVNPEKPPRFASFLRAHIRGARIQSAEQLSQERIVRISLLRGEEQTVLLVRLWGAAANAILTDASGTILDAFYRRPRKGEISGKPFDALAAAQPRAKPGPQKEYAVRELPGSGTFNERLELFFRELETRGEVETMAAQADAELAVSENKVLANIEKLTARLSEYAGLDRLRELGDLLTSNLHAFAKGDRWLKVEDFFHQNAAVEIELMPELTPAQNAERYYDRHRKARLGRSKVEEEIARLGATLEKIQKQRAAIVENPDPRALGRMARIAAKARRPLFDQGTPGLVFSSPPFQIIVGRTASENDELLRRKMRGNDWWFHARDWPGAYVFVKAQPGKSLPLETMLDAATLAMHFSRGKSAGQGDVYYTQVKYLRRPKSAKRGAKGAKKGAKGAKRGTVLPTQEKNLHVKIDPLRIERLKAGDAG